MKICVATSTTSRVGGAETYLADVIPSLAGRGCDVAILCEHDDATSEAGVPVFARERCATQEDLLRRISAWGPDLIFLHGLKDATLEAALLDIAQVAFFVHGYHGTCISGGKRFAFPTMRPCSRTFGPACLAHYYSRRCGGLNPRTMWRLYRDQRRRLSTVRQCDAVIVTSVHMHSEYAKHGVDPDRLHTIPMYDTLAVDDPRTVSLPQANELSIRPLDTTSAHVTFVGRFDRNKGGHLLINAAPLAARALRRRISVNIVGDGPERRRLQRQASRVQASHDDVTFAFHSWLDRAGVAAQLAATELVVVPSVWPEPFGLVGLEAGRLGIPVAAFAVGGITSWLSDGQNGHLAAADPPTAASLAGAIVACLRDESTYQRLRREAAELAKRFNRARHLKALLAVFESVLTRHGAGSTDSGNLAPLVGVTS